MVQGLALEARNSDAQASERLQIQNQRPGQKQVLAQQIGTRSLRTAYTWLRESIKWALETEVLP